jgi:hypothetical protein
MRRLLVMILGLAIAIAAGFVFLLAAGMTLPETRDLAFDLTRLSIFVTAAGMAQSGAPDQVAGQFAFALWLLTTAILVAPPALAALMGELAGWRSFAWYGGASGLLAAAIAFLGHPGTRATSAAENKIMLLLFVTGAISGLVYWAIAGRSTGRSPSHTV